MSVVTDFFMLIFSRQHSMENKKLGMTKEREVDLRPHVSSPEIKVLDQSFSLVLGNFFTITEAKIKIVLTKKKRKNFLSPSELKTLGLNQILPNLEYF